MRKLGYISSYRRKQRKKRIISFTVCAFLAAAALVAYIVFAPPAGEPDTKPSTSHEPSSSLPESQPESSVPPSEPVEDMEESTSSLTKSNPPAEPVTFTYDFTVPVPESEAADNSYFSDAVFIGNSRLQGFVLYSGLSDARSYVDKGLAVDTALSKALFGDGEGKLTAMDALASNPDFEKVYLMFGINELGWVYGEIFAEKYGILVDKIREIQPEAKIYIQSILPVSEKKSGEDKIYNNNKITAYNELLKALAVEKQVYYVNVAEAVADENGALPAEASADGIHLKKAYCEKWLAYLKTHTAEGSMEQQAMDSSLFSVSSEPVSSQSLYSDIAVPPQELPPPASSIEPAKEE